MTRIPLRTVSALSLLAAASLLAMVPHARPSGPRERDGERLEPPPPDWFYAQRAMPDGSLPSERVQAALTQQRLTRPSSTSVSGTSLVWQNVGPYNIGGRVTALATAGGGGPIFLGSANGGVWKSVDGGTSWDSVTEFETFYSIGALALSPVDPNTIYVGTGEANASVDSYDGNGVWHSTDAGASWRPLGLETIGRIARIAVDPQNPQHLLVAAMGKQFSTGPDRGLYRSLDGGQTWNRQLFVSDSTGAGDVVFNPVHPDTVFCSTWERVRHSTYRRAFGAECGIWRSVDRGATWSRLSAGLPAPSDSVGRIALSIPPTRPSTVYAQIASGSNFGYLGLGFYRSTDGGQTWTRRDVGTTFSGDFGGFAWYFGTTTVDPTNPDRVWALGVDLLRSDDGGQSWTDISGSLHPDQHAIWVDPADPNHVIVGNDGGFSAATDGESFVHSQDLPITQFYDGAVDPSDVNTLYGGTQDNNTLKTSSGPASWFPILGGDGFFVLVDPVNPSVVFSEYQYCCSGSGFRRSVVGGPSAGGTSGWIASDRFGWNTPITINPRNHNLLLAGSQFVYRSTNNGITWSKISGDLSTNPASLLLFGTITTLDVSAADTTVYYAGTDDGKVWRTTNRGALWTDITAGLPGRWITRVVADPGDPQGVYVTLSGFSSDDHAALIFHSVDRGSHWASATGNLPDVPANDLVVDPVNPATLYLATDVGVWISHNRGTTWYDLGVGMPPQAVFDLTLQASTRQLFAFTHGRSAWRLDLAALPTAALPSAPPATLTLSSPRPNPARGTVRMTLAMPRDGRAEVVIYDVVGRRVATPLEAALRAGASDVVWDGRGADGRRAGTGVYFARARAGGQVIVQRVVVAD